MMMVYGDCRREAADVLHSAILVLDFYVTSAMASVCVQELVHWLNTGLTLTTLHAALYTMPICTQFPGTAA